MLVAVLFLSIAALLLPEAMLAILLHSLDGLLGLDYVVGYRTLEVVKQSRGTPIGPLKVPI